MKTTIEDLTLLISINDDIAAIRDTESLLFTIFQKLHEFYGIEIGGGAVFDKTKENLGSIIIKIEEGKRVNDSMVWLQIFSVNSSIFKNSISNPGITLLDVKRFHSLQPKNESQSSFGEFLEKMNISTLTVIPMKIGGELIGFLIFALERTNLSEKAEDYLLKLANLIGSVVNNVNAYEEIQRKEKGGPGPE